MLEAYLNDLEQRIDPAVEEALLADWQRFYDGKHAEPWFTPRRQRRAPTALAWPNGTA